MALVLKDRVKEQSTTTGTGSFTLSGAYDGFQTFATAIASGSTVYYCIHNTGTGVSGEWEVGVGTFTSPSTLSRDTILESSNGGTAVTFSAGTKEVFVTYTAEKSIILDASGNSTPLGTVSSGTWQGTAVGIAYGGTGQTTRQNAMDALAGATTAGYYLRGNGTDVVMAAIQAADVPTLNQNTTGSAGSVANALTMNNSGTGAASGTTFNGSAAQTISYNTVGASPLAGSTSLTTTGTVTTGTWSASFGAVSGANLTNLTAGNLAGTIPSAVLGNSTHYVGTTAVALNRASANQALTGISSVTMPGATSGSVQVIPAATAGTGTVFTLPATTGTAITSGDTGTVTNTMLAGSIANAKLANSTISGVALGSNLNALTISTGLSGTSYNGSAAVTIALANTTVTAGSYTYASITVDAQGRLTAASSGAAPQAFPSGTIMLFRQTAAPTGWTKDVTNYNDSALRVVTGTVSSGGTQGFTTAFASQTPAGTVSVTVSAGTLAVGVGTLAAAATTLSTSQIPSHEHGNYLNINPTDGTGPYWFQNGNTRSVTQNYNTGGGGSHTHSVSGSPSLSGSPSVTAASFSGSAINLAVKYCDVIFATKD